MRMKTKIQIMNSKGAGRLIQKERIERHSEHRHNPAEKGVLDIKDIPESARDWYRGSNVGSSAQAGMAALLLSGKHD